MAFKDSILIITNYFPPETGAASNRIFSLAKLLDEHNYNVNVIAPLPNYPQGRIYERYKGKFKVSEKFEGISTLRLWIFPSKSTNKFIRLFSILSFSITLFFHLLFAKLPQKVIVQCSPLFVGFFAVLALKIRGKNIILNVSDLWPLAGFEMQILSKGFYFSILEKIEKFIYTNSSAIIGQSEEILQHISIKTVVGNKKLFLYRNYPLFKKSHFQGKEDKTKVKIVYAGLLGVAQGIETICKEVIFPPNIEFHIYGDGPMQKTIGKYSKENPQIFFHGSLEREKLHEKLQTYNATLIPLKNRIFGSVPSKIFEYAKLGLPIIFYSEGEGADIVEKYGLGLSVRTSELKDLENILISLSEGKIQLPKKDFILDQAENYFDVEKQFLEFEKEILT